MRTLALSILIFSVFTALQGLSQTPLQLGIFRFFAGVGTGAEIIVGIPFVAEVFAEKNRARILGVMMTGGAVGTLLAAQVYHLIGHMGWRWVFYVGIVPALLLVFIRRGMVEPERFAAVRERRQALAEAETHAHSDEDKEFMRFVPLQLFNPQNRFNTLVGLLFCVGTLLAIWTSNIWLPTIQRNILAGEGIQGNDAISYISFGMTMWALGGMLGYAAFGFIADAIGRRPTILLYNVGTLLVGLYLYLALRHSRPIPTSCSCSGSSCSACSRDMRCTCPSCSRPMCAPPPCRSATVLGRSSPASARSWPGCWSASSTCATRPPA